MKRPPNSARLVVLDNNAPIVAETEAIQSRIRQRAFERSQTRPPDAHELYDWIMAESDVVTIPPLKLVEKDGTFDLKFGIAGVSPDDVDVMITADQVLVKGQSIQEENAADEIVHVSDFKSATVFRSVNLPARIDVSTAKVDIKDGMVHVSVAKEGLPDRAKRPTTARKAPAKKSRSKQP